MGFDSLTALVANNNIDGVRTLFQQNMEKNPKEWPDFVRLLDCEHPVSDAMRDAILSKKIDVLNVFLEFDVNPNQLAAVDSLAENKTFVPMIYFAAKIKDLSAVKILVEKGACVSDYRREYGGGVTYCGYALEQAILNDDEECVKYLLENDATTNIYFRGDHIHPLDQACLQKNLKIARLLVQFKADVNDSCLRLSRAYRESLGAYLQARKKYNNLVDKCYGWREDRGTDDDDWNYSAMEENLDGLIKNLDKCEKELHAKTEDWKRRREAVGLLLNLGEKISLDSLIDFKGESVKGFNFKYVFYKNEPITRDILVTKYGCREAQLAAYSTSNIIPNL